jgi:tetratricopeptide (TPR) repeat protein
MGRHDEALIMNIKARFLDPLNVAIKNDVAWINYWARRYDDAIREYQNNLETYPDFIMSHRELGYVYAKKSRFKEAIQSMQRAIALERSAFNLAQLAIVYAMAGQKDEAYEILNELLSTRQTEHLLAYDFVMIHTALGDLDEAFRWLEKSYQEHSVPFLIKTDPLAEPLHFDPRYAAFLRKMGLEP